MAQGRTPWHEGCAVWREGVCALVALTQRVEKRGVVDGVGDGGDEAAADEESEATRAGEVIGGGVRPEAGERRVTAQAEGI
eukprot:7341142-Prymnesium_polylepis.1